MQENLQKTYRQRVWGSFLQTPSQEAILSVFLEQNSIKTSLGIDAFLHPSFECLPDPLLMNGMEISVARLEAAIEKKEKIMVFGDFDADGITSTVILVSALQKLGAIVSYRIPDREKDSHRLLPHHIDEIASLGVNLILTCDCGINEKESVKYAVSKGLDVIVTDHHTPEKGLFPDSAVAVINPHLSECEYPFKDLSGAGIAFFVVSVLASKMIEEDRVASFLEPYLEMCTIGLVADCMPLYDVNRVLVFYGLQMMKQTKWPGLEKLWERSGIDPSQITEETIRFTLAPRINAASRIGDVYKAAQLFLGDESRHYERLTYLESLNQERKNMTAQAVKQAEDMCTEKQSAYVFYDREWKPGIVGLIAGKVSEKVQKPVFVLGGGEDVLYGSGRCPQGYDLLPGLDDCKELLEHYGGHTQAAGLRIKKENIDSFKQQFAQSYAGQKEQFQELAIHSQLPAKLINLELSYVLDQLRPFGDKNPTPYFVLTGVQIKDLKIMGKEQNHVRLECEYEKKQLSIVGFFMDDLPSYIEENGSQYDMVVEFDRSVWQGKERLEIRLIDMRKV